MSIEKSSSVSVPSVSVPRVFVSEPSIESGKPSWLSVYSRKTAAILFSVSAVTALIALAGWILDIEALFSVIPGMASTKFNTALGLLFLSIAGYSGSRSGRGILAVPGILLTTLVILLASLTAIQYILEIDFGIDQLFWADDFTPAADFPGRMSLATAVELIFVATACLFLLIGWMQPARVLSGIIVTVALLVLLAYLFDRGAIYSFFPFSTMALNTAAAFLCLGLGCLFADSEKSYLRFLYLDSVAGYVARKFVPYVLLAPFLVSGFVLLGEYLFGFSTRFGLFAVAAIIAVALIIALQRVSYVIHDIETANKRVSIEEQLDIDRINQMQKIQTMGLIAGGVAHDFRNLLMPIIWAADIGRSNAESSSDERKRYQTIFDSARKASTLAERMMDIGKQQPANLAFLSLETLVKDFSDILRGLGKGGVDISVQSGESVPDVLVDKTQIEQVLINLTSNACHAMGNSGTLKIEISYCCIEAKQMESFSTAQIEGGEYVCLSVTDSGVGMTEKEKESALNPFYSTKKSSVGFGLGLTTVNNIVAQHLGCIDISSQQNKGTTIRVYLPVGVHSKPVFTG